MRRFLYAVALVLISGLVLTSAQAQTDIAASVYGAFSQSTAKALTVQSPSNQAGMLLELRHISNPLIGYEVTYAFNRANQHYQYNGILPAVCPSSGCTTLPSPEEVRANAHEVTADWIVSLKMLNFRPFALAGGGMLFVDPVSGQSNTTSDTKGVFVYGAGVDWTVLPHIGVRLQYRGNLYKAPDLAKAFSSTDSFTHTAEPMAGVFFRF
jgi:opacity protein-like surface antigen